MHLPPKFYFDSADRDILLNNEAVTKEVTVGQWPETPVGKKKFATPIVILTPLNLFESDGAKKRSQPKEPPNTATPMRRSPTLDTLSFSDQARSGPPSGRLTRAESESPSGVQTQAESESPSDLQTQAQSGPPSGLRNRVQSEPSIWLQTRAATWGRREPAWSLACSLARLPV
jgi:hypothetical protein